MKLYIDSSALVKLVQEEAESAALRQFLRRRRADRLVTCALSRVEVVRAVFPGGTRAVEHARRQLARVDQLVVTTDLLDLAAALAPDTLLRSLDAIHLAAASMIEDDLRAIVTYDHRMTEAGEALGFTIEAPR